MVGPFLEINLIEPILSCYAQLWVFFLICFLIKQYQPRLSYNQKKKIKNTLLILLWCYITLRIKYKLKLEIGKMIILGPKVVHRGQNQFKIAESYIKKELAYLELNSYLNFQPVVKILTNVIFFLNQVMLIIINQIFYVMKEKFVKCLVQVEDQIAACLYLITEIIYLILIKLNMRIEIGIPK